MKRRILSLMLAAIAFAVVVSASSAEAGVFQHVRTRSAAYSKPIKHKLRYHHVTRRRSKFPTWAWNAPLDLRMWRWPLYYRD